MPSVMVRYAIPTNLALPGNIAFWTKHSGIEALVRCTPRKGDQLFSYRPDDYSWLNSDNVLIAAVSSSNKSGARWVARKVYMYKDSSEPFSAGYIDPITYTVIDIVMNLPSTANLENNDEMERTKRDASVILTYFIDMYRLVSQHAHLERAEAYNSALITVLVTKDTIDLRSGAYETEFTCLRTTVVWNDPFTKGNALNPLEDRSIELLTRMLHEQRQIRLYEQLLLEAKSQGNLHSNYAMSVVLSETAFEVFVQESLVRLCQQNGIQLLPLGRNRKHMKHYTEAIKRGNITDLLTTIEQLIGCSVKSTPEYSRWFNHAYSTRNRVVHNGELTVTQEEAHGAFNVVVAYINNLEQLM